MKYLVHACFHFTRALLHQLLLLVWQKLEVLMPNSAHRCMCLATAEIKIRGFDFHFSFYPSGLEDILSITDKLNMMHAHMHAQVASCTQRQAGHLHLEVLF